MIDLFIFHISSSQDRMKIPSIPPNIPSALDAVIAEFEAAEGLFESMNQVISCLSDLFLKL